MKRTQELFERIEKYLDDQFSDQERTAFENEMKADQDLYEEVQKHRLLHKILSDQDTIAFADKVKKVRDAMKQETLASSADRRNFFIIIKIGAIIFILIGFIALLWYLVKLM